MNPTNQRWAVVIPSNRPERLEEFMEAWMPLFAEHAVRVIVIDDTPDGNVLPFLLPGHWPMIVTAITRNDITAKFIPQGSDMCRSWGFYLAATKTTAEFILSLDDDVRPLGDPFLTYEAVFDEGLPLSEYLNVGMLTSAMVPMRGFPKTGRAPAEVVVQWGGWHGVLDYDAETQMAGAGMDESFHPVVMPVPLGAAVTGCAMNMAFRREWAEVMWQFPLFEGRYNRWGDIWSGLVAKRVADDMGKVCAINGRASVIHTRASDPEANLAREAPGHEVNELLWEWRSDPGIDITTMREAHAEAMFNFLECFAECGDYDYVDHLNAALAEWKGLFDAYR